MDTRTKIITIEAACALAGGSHSALLVTGYFDVLLAAHVHELDAVRHRLPPGAILIVAITTPAQPLLEPRARAEMAAALAVVDYVVSSENRQIDSLLAAFAADRIVRMEAAHQQRMRKLTEHVHRRQSQ
jgi:bifunctional ADP-heptose synthase (sugar kinase/adenylyltransferase)